jgi:predicted transcriptional regulator
MTDNYNKIFSSLIDTNKFHFYLHPKDLGFMSLGVNKYHLMLTSLQTDGFFDNKRILCNSQTAVEWGIDIFNHYLKDSTRIDKV